MAAEWPRRAIFIDLRTTQHGDLAQSLGCELDEMALVKVDAQAHQCGWRLCRWRYDLQGRAVILAAAQGAMAGLALNMDLLAGTAAH